MNIHSYWWVNRTESPGFLRPWRQSKSLCPVLNQNLAKSRTTAPQFDEHSDTRKQKNRNEKCRIVCFPFPDMVTRYVEWSQKGVLRQGICGDSEYESPLGSLALSQGLLSLLTYLELLVAPSAWYHPLHGLGKRLYSFAIAHRYVWTINLLESIIVLEPQKSVLLSKFPFSLIQTMDYQGQPISSGPHSTKVCCEDLCFKSNGNWLAVLTGHHGSQGLPTTYQWTRWSGP